MAPIRSRTRARGRARAAPYKRPAAKTQKSKINKIINFIKTNKPEVKTGKYTGAGLYNSGDIRSANLAEAVFGSTPQGVNEKQFIGKKINLKWLTIKYQINNAATSLAGGGNATMDQVWRIMVVASKKYTTGNLAGSDLYDDDYTLNNAYCGMFDSDKIKILTSRIIRFKPHLAAVPGQLNGPPITKFGTINFRMNRSMEFVNIASSKEAKMWNYYVVFMTNSEGYAGTSNIITTGDLDYKLKLTYTDD